MSVIFDPIEQLRSDMRSTIGLFEADVNRHVDNEAVKFQTITFPIDSYGTAVLAVVCEVEEIYAREVRREKFYLDYRDTEEGEIVVFNPDGTIVVIGDIENADSVRDANAEDINVVEYAIMKAREWRRDTEALLQDASIDLQACWDWQRSVCVKEDYELDDLMNAEECEFSVYDTTNYREVTVIANKVSTYDPETELYGEVTGGIGTVMSITVRFEDDDGLVRTYYFDMDDVSLTWYPDPDNYENGLPVTYDYECINEFIHIVNLIKVNMIKNQD